jgi:hypothetical protein
MATRSCIAVRTGTARKPRYLAVYCHYDGYPSHQLPILTEHHSSPAAALSLVAGGDISCLHTNLGWDRETRPETGPLYYAERGEKDVDPKEFVEIQALLDHFRECGCEHSYVFMPKLGWVHTDLGKLKPLDAEIDTEDFNWVGSPDHY